MVQIQPCRILGEVDKNHCTGLHAFFPSSRLPLTPFWGPFLLAPEPLHFWLAASVWIWMVTVGLRSVQQESETGWRHIRQGSGYQHPAVCPRALGAHLSFLCGVVWARLQTIIPNLSGLEVRARSHLCFTTLCGLWTGKYYSCWTCYSRGVHFSRRIKHLGGGPASCAIK